MPTLPVEIDVLRHALRNDSLSQIGNEPLQTRLTSSLKIGDVSFTPSADLSLRVLNRADDKDAVFGDSDTAHIPFVLQSAWVKYTMSAKAEGRVAFAPASAGATAHVTLSDYRIHGAADSAFEAVRSDLASARTLLDIDDVKRLQPGEALTMDLGGALTASVSFSWTDVLASKMPEIIGDRLPVAVKLKSGFDTKASVRVSDHFSVVASRTRDGLYRFAVKKAAARNRAFGIEVGLGAEVSAMPGVDEVLDAILANAPPALGSLRSQIRGRLQKAAQWKAAAGFAYEYARVAENTAIADFILLDPTQLAHDHALVLAGDFANMAEVLRQDVSKRQIVRYLNEATITRRSSSGFSLGLGKWALEAKDSSTLEQTTRTSIDGFQLITFAGTRKYEEKNVPQNDFEWTVDLKAQMSDFLEAPRSHDFDYGLHLLATIERGAISAGDLDRMLDFAAMWDVCVPDPATFAEAVGRKGSLRVQMVLDHDALASAIGSDADVASWAEPLAMAMPYMSTFPERRTFGARRDTYAEAWRAWLDRGVLSDIRTDSGLTIFERQKGPGSFAWTAGEGHAQLRQRLDAFRRGVRRLHEAMSTAAPPAAIADAYTDLQQFWSQRLYVAAVGRWLVERGAVRATLQVEYADTTLTA